MSPRKRSRLQLPPDQYKALCKEILKRDGWKCRVPYCGNREALHVHHIVFRSHGGDDAEWNLITVCDRCHHAIHGTLIPRLGVLLIIFPSTEGERIDANGKVKWHFVNGWHPRPSQSKVPSPRSRKPNSHS